MKKIQIFFPQNLAIFLEKKNIEGNTFHFFTFWQNWGKWPYLNNRF